MIRFHATSAERHISWRRSGRPSRPSHGVVIGRSAEADIGWVASGRVKHVNGGIGMEFAVDGRLRRTGGLLRYGGVVSVPSRPSRTPAEEGFRMPPETACHDRTLMGWPCRRELWGYELAAAKREFAGVANAVVAFEPVTMLAADASDAAEARAALSAAVEVIEVPLDDSWMRDNGPIFALDGTGRRAGIHFGFNAWGGKFAGWDRDEAAGGVLAERYGDVVHRAPLVLEGGSFSIDGAGRVVTTEQCLLHPNRNPEWGKADIDVALRDFLGAEVVVWLDRGLHEDRDTDGHVDLIATFTDTGRLLLQSRPLGEPDHQPMVNNRERAVAAGLDVIDFTPLAGPVDAASDEEALDLLAQVFAGREIIGVAGLVMAFGGGGPHCITQQVPARQGRA